jgi:pilus assembly protein CpaB
MNTRSITLLIAILLAIVTGWLTLNYVRGVEQSAANDTTPRNIIVATTDIPARATITAEMLARTTRPASNVEPDAIDSGRLAIGATALITIPSGATITASKIGRPQDAALPVRLRPGDRAVTIQIDRVKGIAGLIQPGDRVDVIAIPPREGNAAPLASTILRGVRVLAIGNTLENTSASPPPDATSTATLEVTPKQADLLAMADINTTLRLALRSPREPVASMPTESIHFADSQPAAAAAPAPAAPQSIVFAPSPQQQAQRPAQSVSKGIPIIDGDRLIYSNDHPNQ